MIPCLFLKDKGNKQSAILCNRKHRPTLLEMVSKEKEKFEKEKREKERRNLIHTTYNIESIDHIEDALKLSICKVRLPFRMRSI